jgi:hypothetical protein
MIFEPTHPNARKDGYVSEHIKVMSAKLGRPLERYEEVAMGPISFDFLHPIGAAGEL